MRNTLLTIILLFLSCSRDSSNSIQVILPAITDTLAAEVKYIEDEIYNLHTMLNVCDKYLIFVENNKTPYFRIYDWKSGNELYKWGEKGSGPNEFREIIEYTILNNYDYDDCRIEMFSGSLGEVLVYIITDSTFVEVDKFKVDYNNRKTSFNDIIYIRDGMYSIRYDMDTKNKRYLMISRHSIEPLFSFRHYESLGERNELRDSNERYELLMQNWDANVVSRDRKQFFSFDRKKNKLDIYNTDDGSVFKNISIIDNLFIVENHENLDVMYRPFAFAGTNKIYAVGLYNELAKLIEIGLENSPFYLEEWDLNGLPSRRYLMEKPFDKAVVIGDKLYGFSSTFGNQYFVYTIPK